MGNPFRPKPGPPGFGQGKIVPETRSSYFSRAIFSWLDPLLWLGYTRPLEHEDLWDLPVEWQSTEMAHQIERNFYSRCPPDKRPAHLRDISSYKHQDESFMKALHRTFMFQWWAPAVLKVVADALNTTAPLVNKELLNWLVLSYAYHDVPADLAAQSGISQPKGIGYGIGLAFALFVMREASVLFDQFYEQLMMRIGMRMRAGAVGAVHRKALRLSTRSRLKHSVGQVITLISKDSESLNHFAMLAHMLWIAPIQIIVAFGLLIWTLGYSALAGFGVIFGGLPIMFCLVAILTKEREKGTRWTDKRVRATSEVIQGIRLVKFFSWENFFEKRIAGLREHELTAIRNFSIAISALIAMFNFMPVGAQTISFVTYSLTGHDLNVATIFTALQFFNILQLPLVVLPLVLDDLADFKVSSTRYKEFMLAEELQDPYEVDSDLEHALEVDASFIWDNNEEDYGDGKPGKGEEKQKEKKTDQTFSLPSSVKDLKKATEVEPEEEKNEPFVLRGLKMFVPRGSFQTIIGRIGSGKTSIFEALLGEMRRTEGKVQFSGEVAYVPQIAWIRNQTLRDNILFGQSFDEKRYRDVVRACCLEPDIAILPNGDMTEIGEKGVNLSGGQRARVSLARAAYSSCPIVFLDDPLSAVDAHVGQSIMENCLLNGPLSNRTRVLVTHALHILPSTDYIYMIDSGRIVSEGTYTSLASKSSEFSNLMQKYSGLDDQDATRRKTESRGASRREEKEEVSEALMQVEERLTGAVSWDVYKRYFQRAGGISWAPLIFVLVALGQAAQVMNSLAITWWIAGEFPSLKQGHYMALYAGIGGLQVIMLFTVSLAFLMMSVAASRGLFSGALHGLLHSSISYFDTTPTGRILSRLSKDQDTADTQISLTGVQFLTIFSSIFGTVALVAYTFPWLTLIFIPLVALYYLVSLFYRATSVEVKRLDSILRSALYASVSESLTGLTTIRAYHREAASIEAADRGQNMENQAYYITQAIQRWLTIRLDTFGNFLVLGIGLFAAGFRNSVNPAKIGNVLTYTLNITQMLSQMVMLIAQIEQAFNSVERLLVYSDLREEGSDNLQLPPNEWPEKPGIAFKDVELSYRPGLPVVLKGVSFDIRPGEKFAVCGRTGSGKSTLLQALFRMVELQQGKIEIDGLDISQLDLDSVRSKMAIVAQESPLFYGTIRQNIDPEGRLTDVELISILQRTGLLPSKESSDPVAEAKFSLNCAVGEEGSNYSTGEKQLIALCRALAKNSKIIVLDEATSSVDAETDAKIQQTIRTELADRTLICIAHRIGTIVSYDRVLVMHEGNVGECGPILELFDQEHSMFRSLCDDASLKREDIVKVRREGA